MLPFSTCYSSLEGLYEVALLLRTLCETVVEGDQVGIRVCLYLYEYI